MWNNSFKALTHEYCKKGSGILQMQKGLVL